MSGEINKFFSLKTAAKIGTIAVLALSGCGGTKSDNNTATVTDDTPCWQCPGGDLAYLSRAICTNQRINGLIEKKTLVIIKPNEFNVDWAYFSTRVEGPVTHKTEGEPTTVTKEVCWVPDKSLTVLP